MDSIWGFGSQDPGSIPGTPAIFNKYQEDKKMKKQYKEPEEMIDHNGNLDTVSGLMSIFFAYNQKES